MTSPLSPAQAAAELLRRRRGRASLVGYANAVEIPGKPIDDDPDGWLFKPVETGVASHHRLFLEAMERTAARPHGRCMIFAPPGSAKSSYASVVAPTYFMGRKPDQRIILGSYGTDLARRHGRRARQIANSPGFRALWSAQGFNPARVELSASTSAADEWALTNGSEYLARGLLAGITGSRAHGIVIDDPVKGREQADSPTIRQKTWEAYTDDLLTRLIPGGWIFLIQTRWHEDDLAGRILPKNYAGQSGMIECRDGMVWEVINLPAQAEQAEDPLGRQVGEYIWPEWFDETHWHQHKQNSRTWAALFQQRPRPDEGGVFKAKWCVDRYRVIPREAKVCVHSWDTAQKEKQINDPTVGTFWHFGQGTRYYLREVYRDRVDYPTLKAKVIAYAERDRPAAILIEDKSSGQSLIQELRNTTSLPIVPIEPEGNKLFRAQEVSTMVESGLLALPQAGELVDVMGRPLSAPWLIDFEAEFFGFPLSTNDDQVDSVSQFLRWVRSWTGRIESVGAGLTRTQTEGMFKARETGGGFGSIRRSESTEGF